MGAFPEAVLGFLVPPFLAEVTFFLLLSPW